MLKRHKHNWNLEDKQVLPGLNLDGEIKAHGYGVRMLQNMLDGCRDQVVYVFKCECGDVKVEKR